MEETKLITGQKVLCVEDNPINIMVLCRNLRALGGEPVQAVGGEDALSKLNEETSIIISDIMMPGICGNEFAIMAKSLYPEIPIISWSASSCSIERDFFDGDLHKPYAKTDLINILLTHLPFEKMYGGSYSNICINTSDLVDEISRKEEFVQMLTTIKEHLLDHYKTFEAALLCSDKEKIKFCLHKMKGGSGVSGFDTLSRIVSKVEAVFKNDLSRTDTYDYISLMKYFNVAMIKFNTGQIEFRPEDANG